MERSQAAVWMAVAMLAVAASGSEAVRSDLPTATERLQDAVEAMIGAGDLEKWANILYTMDATSVPPVATFFAPTDTALSTLLEDETVEDSVLEYHIVPRSLSYFDLQRFPVGMHLPTLSTQPIIITSNSRSNYSLGCAHLIRPDIYFDGNFAVHGVSALLHPQHLNPNKTSSANAKPQLSPNATASPPSPSAPDTDFDQNPTPLPSPTSNSNSNSNSSSTSSPINNTPASPNTFSTPPSAAAAPPRSKPSDAPCLCREFPVAITAVCLTFVIRVLRIPLR